MASNDLAKAQSKSNWDDFKEKNIDKSTLEKATFAGGCFWCIEASFEKVEGVVSAVSGYTGGEKKDPSYKEVSRGGTKHIEAVIVYYHPKFITYTELVNHFWKFYDPTDSGGSFADRGHHYTSAIFYHNDEQKIIAEKSKLNLIKSKIFRKPIVTPIIKSTPFYEAETYHQNYYKKNPGHYNSYRIGSGRDNFIKNTWKNKSLRYIKPTIQELKKKLSSLQFKVTQNDGTETPFKNEFFKNKKEGIYVDIVSGEPLFLSTHKFDSQTGWPSFYKPISEISLKKSVDHKLGYSRNEIRSAKANSHLGHVFRDGPQPTGLRYCINSAALKFIPKNKMKSKGFEKFILQLKK
ncbi:MAG: methionine sulfoxide reductase [Planctomycetota bacterium]|nr:MAG: methionine sulfoxide reductase [Planctomycetota bacterium]